ncbi:hypothetical protein Tco_1079837 [Tanacetum coccineum]|uniref:Uncharacterized protein n=1 Tax=Tanacetum coccineum TaxID=301880 RepID=A0ABQ5HT35_9ASTR
MRKQGRKDKQVWLGRIERCLDVEDSEPLHASFLIRNILVANAGNVIGTQQSQVVGVDGEGTSNGARRTNVARVRGAKTVRERRKTRIGIKNTSETSACNRRGAELYEILIVYISWYKSYDDACFFDDVKRIGADNSMIADMPVWKGKSYAVYTCVWNNFIDSGKTILGVDIRIAIFLCGFPIAGAPFKLWLHPGFLQ